MRVATFSRSPLNNLLHTRVWLAYGVNQSDGVRRGRRRLLSDEPELAYTMSRYREVHDFLHVLTGLPPTVEGELALKTLEAVQVRLKATLQPFTHICRPLLHLLRNKAAQSVALIMIVGSVVAIRLACRWRLSVL
eukprot:COSAG01_NODE_987_length_12316_cov_167.856348_1_plen_135_part_00